MWLPRFVDKTRLHLVHGLPKDVATFFEHQLATDGVFLNFFDLNLDDIVESVRAAGPQSDDTVATWFRAQPGATPPRIAAWNTQAFDLGKPGQPMHRSFNWACRRFYNSARNPRINSVFSGIAWDEGYLDELPIS
ncbi:MAG: DUF5069 domain-containing protein [Candidatus Synoicihabitans palmerolidicus]|nr:DUF5069 domain-containing protein [Candidatus Synoicihabitans palmerolidicus]